MSKQHFYKNGKLKGECKIWHQNGQLFVYCCYRNDKLEDKYKQWYENGQSWIHHGSIVSTKTTS
jgi:antitoxin component YwqK of YwqJK toxin-antitoxin module